MRRERNPKIVATLGPASSSPDRIRTLFEAGADVFRLNFSHDVHEEHRRRLYYIRELERVTGRPIGVLMDLQGPKLRVGEFENGSVTLSAGDFFRFDLSTRLGTQRRAPLPHPEIFRSLSPGTSILLDDGRIRLRVRRCGKGFAETEVVVGGQLSDHKGVNVPDAVLELSAITDKDRRDIEFGLDMGVDWLALSFVQRPQDIIEVRQMVQGDSAILTKIEKPHAVECLDEIVDLSDAVMVARGDLGVEMPPEQVPIIQKRIIRAGRRAGKPVVVATQMLDSMVHAPSPTRAEASDVATAVYDGADAVMLSAETAIGEFPVESVKMMARIIERVEKDPSYRKIMDANHPEPEATIADAISAAAAQVAHTISAAAIVTYSRSGATARRSARERPDVPIVGLSAERITARQLSLVWGVHCVHTTDIQNFTEMVNKACRTVLGEGIAKVDDRIVITAGVPFGKAGTTNILRIATVKESDETDVSVD
ncbi:MAG: pyruvate kinase [Alphaproteobacteria bacterium]